MDDLILRLSERLAGQRSRRGMLTGLGKVALGVGALVVGQSLFGQVAEAAASMHCCDGKACANYVCPSGTHLGYTWHCGHYFCHDCFSNPAPNSNVRGQYNCTYSVARPVHHPKHHQTHHTVHHTVHHEAPHPKQYAAPHGDGKVM